MNEQAIAYVTLPDNKLRADPGVTVIDDQGNEETFWDFGAWAPEEQTLSGAEDLLEQNGWRSMPMMNWQESGGQWSLLVERI